MSEHNDSGDILSVLKNSISKGLRVVNIRSKEAYGTVRIKNKISSNKKKQSKAIHQVGESVYKMFKLKDSFDNESLRSKCVEIAKIEQQQADLEEELRVLHESALHELGKLKAISKPDDES